MSTKKVALRFDIELIGKRQVYIPGSTIEGNVVLVASKVEKIHDLKVVFSGEARTYWTVTVSNNTSARTFLYSDTEVLFSNQLLHLLSDGDNQDCSPVITAGVHKFPFQFQLPVDGCPSSFQSGALGTEGSIRYRLTATVTQPTFKTTVQRDITVNEMVDINVPQLIAPLSNSNEKTVCCLWCASGPISLSVTTDRGGYCIGESIGITVEAKNNSKRRVTVVRASLKQKATLFAKDRTFPQSYPAKRVEENIIQRIEGPGIEPGGLTKLSAASLYYEKVIWQILTACTNAQRQRISVDHTRIHGRDLIKDLKSEFTGNSENVMVSLMCPKNRFAAMSLRKAIKGLGTDEGALIEILCTKTNQEIKDVIREYKEEYNRDLVKDIKDDTSGHFRMMFESLLQANCDESTTVDESLARADAQALYDAGEGKWGTDESKFNNILITRSHSHLRRVFDIYGTISKRDIYSAIESEMSGDLESGMIAIVDCVYSCPTYFAKRLYKAMKGLGTKDNTLVRVIVSRHEIDLPKIKAVFKDTYGKTLYEWVHGETSGIYRDALLALVGQD